MEQQLAAGSAGEEGCVEAGKQMRDVLLLRGAIRGDKRTGGRYNHERALMCIARDLWGKRRSEKIKGEEEDRRRRAIVVSRALIRDHMNHHCDGDGDC
ncbi:hypothetical protein B296_00056793 [Ensete ventricosum]|uniref:Uncharacterized protein n=1 Tax=Ensete ventricosum TaxID=4639 RepID=A0A426XUG1_ENSVE|nr:hypothetical protein B296_00056793 [Ensete ventricosum]